MADSSYYQEDYIRHPVIYELSHKYGLQTENVPEAALPGKLEELKELLRREIRKELKIKEGAEKLREVAKDRRSLADVATIVKKANNKLAELQAELQELESQIILSQGQASTPSPGLVPSSQLGINNGQDSMSSPLPGQVPVPNDGLFTDLRLLSLDKQLNIELKVKQGAENMIQSLTSSHSRDKKLLAEAQQMLADSRAKIEFLKMRILKVKQSRQQQLQYRQQNTPSNGDTLQSKDKFEPNLELPLEERVEELRHRLRIEAAVVEGAKNVIRLLQSSKVADKKALQESSKKLSRSPARLRGKSPLLQSRKNSLKDSRETTPETGHHKHRTVHIDVYCTGSEDADASTSDTADDTGTFSSPQTVFESEKLKVVHKRAGKNELPQALLPQGIKPEIVIRSESLKCTSNERQEICRGFDSDDGLSSQYPSKQSSYTNFEDSESSLLSDIFTTSRDPSSSTISTSSCPILNEDYDSIAATSWKDTVTEVESLDQSILSLALSDSFEYADAMDKLRIKEKEKAWASSNEPVFERALEDGLEQSKTSKAPNTEHKHVLQQQKFNEYLKKHHGTGFPLWKSDTTEESEDDDETGDAWIFSATGLINSPKFNTIKREGTVKKACTVDLPNVESIALNQIVFDTRSLMPGDSGSLSDSGTSTKHRFIRRDVIGPFGVKLPTPPPSKLESVVTSPFTAVGRGTNHWFKAQKFGTIVGAFRKPGHHVGPARNPDCTCEHCREYYETIGRRGRAHSVGDVSYANYSNSDV